MKKLNYQMIWVKYKIILFILTFLALTLFFGYFGTRWQARITDQTIRESLLEQAVLIAKAIDPYLARELSFTPSDEGSVAYERIREQLMKYGQLINQRGIYSFALMDGILRFGPENYPEDDPMGAGHPGTVYEEPSAEDYKIFKTGKPVVMGPQTDEYGTFISAIAPVTDPVTDDVIMVVGIDILYESYQKMLWRDKIKIFGLTIIIGLVFVIGIIINLTWKSRKDRLLRHLETIITAVSGLLITLSLTALFYNQETMERVKIFNNMFLSMAEEIDGNLWDVRNNVESIVRFFQSSEFVDDNEFAFFTDPLALSSHVSWYQWIDYVPADDLPMYDKYMKKFYDDRFFVWEKDNSGIKKPVTGRNIYYPIRQTAPKGLFPELTGFDLNSSPKLQEEFFNTTIWNQLTANTIMPVFTDELERSEIVIIQAGYKQENIKYSPPLSTDLLGFASAILNIEGILRGASGFLLGPDTLVHIHFVDLTDKDGIKNLISYPKISYDTCPLYIDRAHLQDHPFYKTFPVFLFGRPYALILHPTDDFYRFFSFRTTYMMLLGGILITAILTIFIGYIRNREYRLEKLVEKRTQALRERMKELACLSAVRAETLGYLNKAALLRIIQYVKIAMQYSDIAFPIIELNGEIYSAGKINIKQNHSISSFITVGNSVYGRLWVLYTEDKPFLDPEEENLIKSVSEIIGLWYERKVLADREAHTKKVLMGIRNVNQLIVKENDPIALIRTACNNLTETLGYQDAWISLIDENYNITLTEYAGEDVCGFEAYKDMVTNQTLPACIQKVIETRKFIYLKPFNDTCLKCPYLSKKPGFGLYSAPLNHRDKVYGILTVGLPGEFSDVEEEKQLFVEVAEDIGFALYKIEMEEQRKIAETNILKNLHEKEILLQEIHHRVKNNLNVISSLLNLQARKISGKEDALEAFRNSSNRIMAMALVHKKLYDTKDFDKVDLNSYFTSLASQLVSAYGHQSDIKISTETTDVVLDINMAVPCGLILNELISNSLKHAFTDRDKGQIQIKAEYSDDSNVVITIRDDGRGLPEIFDIESVETLGLHLVKLLTQQINGSLSIRSDDGTTFIIKFPGKRDKISSKI